MLTVANALKQASKAAEAHSETPALDAQTLLAGIMRRPRSWLLAHPEAHLTPRQHRRLNRACTMLAQGIPLPYVLGRWEFYGRKFAISPAVLIPRPETETLVELALAWLRAHPGRRRTADIGTGSGIIAVTLAAEIPDLTCTATDISEAALGIAALNASAHKVAERIRFVHTDLLEGVPETFDLIAANLPYIPSKRLASLEVARREPRIALDGGADGLALIRRLLTQAQSRLRAGGVIMLEIDDSHAQTAPETARSLFPNAEIQIHRDLANRPRVLAVQLRHSPKSHA